MKKSPLAISLTHAHTDTQRQRDVFLLILCKDGESNSSSE